LLNKKKQKTPKMKYLRQRGVTDTTNHFALHYRNLNEALHTAEGTNEPVDPATEKNYNGPSRLDINVSLLDSSSAGLFGQSQLGARPAEGL